MAGDENKAEDFYAVMGLEKQCSDLELRSAYKKLAMKWHPDKCRASENENKMEESKGKFQEIQKAYSVLSDSNKRFLYDVGVYDNNDDNDENGMGDFLGEMAQMINESKPSGNEPESFEDLQRLFVEMFDGDPNGGLGGIGFSTEFCWAQSTDSFEPQHCSSLAREFANGSNKRGNSAMESTSRTKSEDFDLRCMVGGDFCLGLNDEGQSSSQGRGASSSQRRNGRKQRTSCRHDVSSNDTILLS